MTPDTNVAGRGFQAAVKALGAGAFGTSSLTRQTTVLLLAVTSLVMVAFIAVFGVHRLTDNLTEAKVFVDIGAEANLPTWWNSSLLLLVAATAAFAAIRSPGRKVRLSWIVVAGAGAYLSLDEAAGLHERMARLAAGVDTPTYPWLVAGSVAAAVGAALLIVAGRRLPRSTARRLLLALACYAAGALGVEAVNGFISEDGHGLLFSLGLILEEGLKMLACIIAIAAIVDYLVAPDGQVDSADR